MKKILLVFLGVLFAAGLSAGDAPPDSPPASREYDVKAVFLFNFAQFVEWPDAAFADDSAPVCIGVLGSDPFGDALARTVRGETVRGRGIIIKSAKDAADLKSCHVVFVSKSEKAQVRTILEALKDSHVLTVGETGGFAEAGGVINFFLQGGKVKFEINTEAAHTKGLKISAQLLGVARLVEKPK
jgi:hypothetical protein